VGNKACTSELVKLRSHQSWTRSSRAVPAQTCSADGASCIISEQNGAAYVVDPRADTESMVGVHP
jgi:hypothetical protein